MNISQIGTNVEQVMKSFSKVTFIYEFLLAYGIPKATISKLQKGNLNLSKENGEISWKKKLFFRELETEDLHDTIDTIKNEPKYLKHDPRFIIVTDYEQLLAIDTKTQDTLDIELKDIAKHFDFFLPWAGMEKAQHQNENPADVKAAERMAKLYDEIKKDNPTTTESEVHNLNVFLSRLLFCFFAEDTDIFSKGQFINAIDSHTQPDGSDLNSYLDNLFIVLNTEPSRRQNLPAYLDAFPYVNGGLFRNVHHAPVFTRKSRQAVIDSGELNWSAINPDIFGSMIQAVITPEHRGGLGMHYTSVPNIMKVIEPLFLNDLYEEFEAGKNEPRRLNQLLDRLTTLKIFDSACGSGNFLIIAYKELRLLEIKILQQLRLLQRAATGYEPYQLELIPKAQLTLAASFQQSMFSRIELSQFYGIELDDFAHEIAILSLWLAQHQMNTKFKEVFGSANPTLPLQAGGNIVHGNATRLNWEDVCPKTDGCEVYLLGNPPYLGYALQSDSQKEDMIIALKNVPDFKKLDYIACWFYLGSKYIQGFNAKFAFVTTNSICQGEQVSILWPSVFSLNLEIGFAHQSFKWRNNAKSVAAVAVAIIGLRNLSSQPKKLFIGEKFTFAKNINAYLIDYSNIFILSRSNPLSEFPTMIKGCSPGDNGNLILSSEERETILSKYPEANRFIKLYLGADEFLNSGLRYCLWIEDDDVQLAYSIPEFVERFEKCKDFRLKSKKEATRKKADTPHEFDERKYIKSNSIIVPQTGSERRRYVPIGFLNSETIISNAARVIYNCEPYLFSIISSLMHIVWVKAVAGRLKTDMQYSNTLCYNTFPFPKINDEQKQELEKHMFRILEERELHSEKTLAKLYDPEYMPLGLKEAHRQLDFAIEKCYRSKPFESDEERLEFLFKLYEQMILEEKTNSGEIIFDEPKLKKKRQKKNA